MDMPLSAPGSRDAEAAERRSSVWERTEAVVSGVGELDDLRHRQELLVRAALERPRVSSGPGSGTGSGSGLLLEENILLLKKQLSYLHRPDAGLVSQLQDLDRQINDLRLDGQLSQDPLETESRPSSGFYDLSDALSGSLSNSSNSVFSECFCLMANADRRVLPTGGSVHGLDRDSPVGGLCGDSSSSSSICCSLSSPHPPSLESTSSDLWSMFRCDLDNYPRSLHAVVVQDPLQVLDHGGWTRSGQTASDCGPPPPSVPQSLSQRTQKRLDGYIHNLLQRRPQPILTCRTRTSRPRTSIGTDSAQSILRQASLCARQMSGTGSGTGTWFPPRQISNSNTELIQSGLKVNGSRTFQNKVNVDHPALITKRRNSPPPSTTTTKDVTEVECPSVPPERIQPLCGPSEDSPRASEPGRTDKEASPGLEPTGQGSLSKSQDKAGGGQGGDMLSATSILMQPHNVQQYRENVKVNTEPMVDPTNHQSHKRSTSTRHRTGELGHVNISRRTPGGSSGQRPPASVPGDQVMHQHSVQSGGSRRRHHGNRRHSSHRHHGNHCHGSHHHHGNQRHGSHYHYGNHRNSSHRHHAHCLRHSRDQVVVVAKLKHKRRGYWRVRATTGVPYDEAFRHTQHCQRKEKVNLSSPYSYVAGSDSECTSECTWLFHSTVVDSSEEHKSDRTTDRFGDGESSGNEVDEEGGAGLMSTGWGQMGRGKPTEQEVTQTKAYVRIKASHNLKKRILRFRAGSLKLITTI